MTLVVRAVTLAALVTLRPALAGAVGVLIGARAAAGLWPLVWPCVLLLEPWFVAFWFCAPDCWVFEVWLSLPMVWPLWLPWPTCGFACTFGDTVTSPVCGFAVTPCANAIWLKEAATKPVRA